MIALQRSEADPVVLVIYAVDHGVPRHPILGHKRRPVRLAPAGSWRIVADPDIAPILSFGRALLKATVATLLMTVNRLTLHRLSWLRQDSP
jgi:hypothetical protein